MSLPWPVPVSVRHIPDSELSRLELSWLKLSLGDNDCAGLQGHYVTRQ